MVFIEQLLLRLKQPSISINERYNQLCVSSELYLPRQSLFLRTDRRYSDIVIYSLKLQQIASVPIGGHVQ